jgi:hypothetical protein
VGGDDSSLLKELHKRCFKRPHTHCAHLLCNQQEDFLFELNLLRDHFISNGYPKKLVKTAVKKSWKIELEKEMKALLLEQIRNNKRRQVISTMFSMHHISQDFQSSWQKIYNPYILVYLSKKEELFTAQSAN